MSQSSLLAGVRQHPPLRAWVIALFAGLVRYGLFHRALYTRGTYLMLTRLNHPAKQVLLRAAIKGMTELQLCDLSMDDVANAELTLHRGGSNGAGQQPRCAGWQARRTDWVAGWVAGWLGG